MLAEKDLSFALAAGEHAGLHLPGARVALDLLHDRDTELTRLELVRSRPIPFPPEPLRYAVIQATRRALARADDRGGKRGPWLRGLDRIGAGFDS